VQTQLLLRLIRRAYRSLIGHIETFEHLNCAPDICHSNSLHQLKRAQ